MLRILSTLAIAAVFVVPTPADAQGAGPITPGMSLDEVRAVLGTPAVTRESDGWTYFFYTNRCLPRCGTDDTVFFFDGRVVSAVLHSPARRYAGPAAASAIGGVRSPAAGRAPAPAPDGATVTGVRVRTSQAAPPAAPTVHDMGVISGRMRSTTPAASGRQAADAAAVAPDAEAAAAPAAPFTQPRPAAPPPPPAPAAGAAAVGAIAPNTIRGPSSP